MSSLSAADSLASNTMSGQSILPNGKQLNQEEETGTTKPSAKVIVTFFARPRASLWRSSPRIGFSPCLEFDFTGLLASLSSNNPPAIPSFESLSPSVYQATYTTSALDTLNLRHHPLVSAFETSHGVEMVFDVLTESTASHRPVQLVIFDMDSTLIKEEVIDELARSIGVTSAVSAITERAMNGEIDFAESLRARLALLKGVPTSIWKELENSLSIATGAKELCAELRRKGVITAVASGGFIPMAEWLKDQLGLDYAFANHLTVSEPTPSYPFPHLTGELSPDHPVITASEKREILLSLAAKHGIPLVNTMAVGDGANDLQMLGAAGLGVAWRAKEKVQREAPHRLNGASLEELLFLLGMGKKQEEEWGGVEWDKLDGWGDAETGYMEEWGDDEGWEEGQDWEDMEQEEDMTEDEDVEHGPLPQGNDRWGEGPDWGRRTVGAIGGEGIDGQ